MLEREIKRELTEKITDQSVNACICLKKQENGEYLPVYVNHVFEEMFSVKAEEVCAVPLRAKEQRECGKSGIAGCERLLERLQETKRPQVECYYDRQKDRYLRMIASIPMEHYVCLTIIDITDLEHSRAKIEAMCEEMREQMELLNTTQNSLEEAKRVYKLISENATDAFVYYDYRSGSVCAADKWYSMFPVSETEICHSEKVMSYIKDEYREAYMEKWKRAVRERKETEKFLYRMANDDVWISQISWLWYDEQGNLKEAVSFYQDVTFEMLQREELEKLAYYDSFTDVYNRNYFTRWMSEQIKNADSDRSVIQMIYIDIDHFKWVNDRLGIPIADELLLKFAAIVQQYESEDVKAARFSNDEFVLGLKQTHTTDMADKIAAEIRERLKAPISLSNGTKYYLTVSIGIAECDHEIQTAADLIRAADLAMIASKKAGRNIVTHYESYMVKGFVGEAVLEQKLRSAVEQEDFYLVYQPQFESKSVVMRGVEALIRWHDEELGNISPAVFIPIAEENGTINQIGEFVIKEALKTLNRWTREFAYQGMMSINISVVQFRDGGFLDTLKYYTDWYGLNPEKIEIELTESVFIDNFEDTIKLIQKIRNFGYKISLDDFGTGYSSLSYLRVVPIDTLKIDRSFITELSREKNATIITTSIIDMAEKLGLEVIAEGVEEKAQLECLRENQCGTIQGYLLGKPLKQEAVEELLLA